HGRLVCYLNCSYSRLVMRFAVLERSREPSCLTTTTSEPPRSLLSTLIRYWFSRWASSFGASQNLRYSPSGTPFSSASSAAFLVSGVDSGFFSSVFSSSLPQNLRELNKPFFLAGASSVEPRSA